MKQENHEQNFRNKIQNWIPGISEEEIENILDYLSQPECGGIIQEVHEKIDEIEEENLDNPDFEVCEIFYKIWDNWDENQVKTEVLNYYNNFIK